MLPDLLGWMLPCNSFADDKLTCNGGLGWNRQRQELASWMSYLKMLWRGWDIAGIGPHVPKPNQGPHDLPCALEPLHGSGV